MVWTALSFSRRLDGKLLGCEVVVVVCVEESMRGLVRMRMRMGGRRRGRGTLNDCPAELAD
jgi:hypothetical protein